MQKDNEMKNVLVDFRTSKDEINALKELEYNVLICPPCSLLYEAVCGHPDMLIHIIDNNTLIVHKDMDKSFINKLQSLNKKVILSSNSLKSSYPYDIALNAVNLPDLLIHRLKYTDPHIIHAAVNKKMIDVRQGYTKCSVAVVSKNAIITSDISIAKSLYYENIDVLLIPPGDILLPGLDYGFIGGTCGLLENNILAFYGNLDYYKYGSKVYYFLEKHGIKPFFLRKGKLMDRGSIYTI